MHHFITIGFLFLTLVGCGRAPTVQHASLPERYYVMEAALRYMFDQSASFGKEREVESAYVIERGEFSSEFVSAFKGYKPTVTDSIDVSTERGMALDKATDKPVKLWSVKIGEMNGDHATAYVDWYSSREAAAGYRIQLLKKGGRWIVDSAKMVVVS